MRRESVAIQSSILGEDDMDSTRSQGRIKASGRYEFHKMFKKYDRPGRLHMHMTGLPVAHGTKALRKRFVGTMLMIIERPRPPLLWLFSLQVRLLPLVWLFLDFVQMIMFNNVPFVWTAHKCVRNQDGGIRSLDEAPMLGMTGFFSHPVWYYVLTVMVWAGFVMMAVLFFLVTREVPKGLRNFFGNYINVVATFFYTLAMRVFWAHNICSVGGRRTSEWSDPERCPNPTGLPLSLSFTVSTISSLYFVTSSVMLGFNSFELDPNASHILRRGHGIVDALYAIIKTILVAGSLVSSVFARSLINLFCFLIMFLAMLLFTPHHVGWVNQLRQGLFLGMVWSASIGIWNAQRPSCTEWPKYIFVIGLVPIVLVGWRLRVPPIVRRVLTSRCLGVLHHFYLGSVTGIMSLGLSRLVLSATRLGQIATALEDDEPDAAETYYRRAIRADPKHTTNLGRFAFHVMRTSAQNTEHRWKLAEKLFTHALRIDPSHTENHSLYGLFLNVCRKSEVLADAQYRLAVQTDPAVTNLRKHFSSLNEGLAILSAEGRILECNALMLRMFCAATRVEFCSMDLFALSPQTQRAGDSLSLSAGHLHRTLVSPGEIHRFEWEFTRLNGTPLVTEVALTSIVRKGGERLIHASITDVSSTGTMKDRNSKLAVLLATMSDGVVVIGNDGLVSEVNPALMQMVGVFNRSKIIGQPFIKLLDLRAMRKRYQQERENVNAHTSAIEGLNTLAEAIGDEWDTDSAMRSPSAIGSAGANSITASVKKRGPFAQTRRRPSQASAALNASIASFQDFLSVSDANGPTHGDGKAPDPASNSMSLALPTNGPPRSISRASLGAGIGTGAESVASGASDGATSTLSPTGVQFETIFGSVVGQSTIVYLNRDKPTPLCVEMSLSVASQSTSQQKQVYTAIMKSLEMEQNLGKQEYIYRWLSERLLEVSPPIIVYDDSTMVIGEFNSGAQSLLALPASIAFLTPFYQVVPEEDFTALRQRTREISAGVFSMPLRFYRDIGTVNAATGQSRLASPRAPKSALASPRGPISSESMRRNMPSETADRNIVGPYVTSVFVTVSDDSRIIMLRIAPGNNGVPGTPSRSQRAGLRIASLQSNGVNTSLSTIVNSASSDSDTFGTNPHASDRQRRSSRRATGGGHQSGRTRPPRKSSTTGVHRSASSTIPSQRRVNSGSLSRIARVSRSTSLDDDSDNTHSQDSPVPTKSASRGSPSRQKPTSDSTTKSRSSVLSSSSRRKKTGSGSARTRNRSIHSSARSIHSNRSNRSRKG